MRGHIPIKLGPMALLLTVVSICMTVLGILAFTTAQADLRLAEKYADTVRLRYGLEMQGQVFLREVREAVADGVRPDRLEGTETDENGVIRKEFRQGNFYLRVGIVPEGASDFRVVEWKMQREWEPEESLGELWSGE